MGRLIPSAGVPPPSQRKDTRAKKAKQTINKDIPAILQAHPRAREGVEASELIVDPASWTGENRVRQVSNAANVDGTLSQDRPTGGLSSETSTGPKAVRVRLQVADVLEAAAKLRNESTSRRGNPPRVAILNMASPLRPGGGFLNGATSQEESICMRTTLYPSLKEDFYRLPEVGAVYTPDVLVFRSHSVESTDLPKHERFFVDVITSAMHRLPDLEETEDGEKRYAVEKDREHAEMKMRAVLRIAKSKGVQKVVLGAWGCGAYGNPIAEIASAWRRVILDEKRANVRSKGKASQVSTEPWHPLEIIFAIKEKSMARSFGHYFGANLELDECERTDDDDGTADDSEGEESVAGGGQELQTKIAELKSQIAATRSEVLAQRLTTVLSRLQNPD